jgi:nucleotide-binding universal stress UspA family protein
MRRRGGRIVLVTTRWDRDSTEPREYLEKVSHGVDSVETETVVIYDRPAEEAIAVVLNDAPGRTVCMTTHGRGRLRWAVLGSVAERVIHDARDPVLLVGRHCASDWPAGGDRLLIGIDGSTDTPAVVPPAIEWAKALGLDVVVAVAIHPLDREPPSAAVKAVTRHIESQGVRAHWEIVRSSYPAGALADLADEHHIDLIAVNSHARVGAARLALGSVTMGVVGLAHCPVLVTKTA